MPRIAAASTVLAKAGGAQKPAGRKLLRTAWLTALVHADAFRFAPLLYLQGIAWRVRGLRVRSRNRIAMLAGRSTHAYALWIERHENATPVIPEAIDRIQAIIDCRKGTAGLDATLRSLQRARIVSQPIILGTDSTGLARQISHPVQLARMVDGHEWLLPMQAGDEIAAGAAAFYMEAAAQAPDARSVYADDDLLDSTGMRHSPHFKPDWNPELFEHHDYVTGSCVVRADRRDFSNFSERNWASELVASALKSSACPIHLSRVLHHRKFRPTPLVPPKPRTLPPGVAPSVTVIVPTRNRHELLRTCIEGLRQTNYGPLETIVVDNGSDDPAALNYLDGLSADGVNILQAPGPFNYSALNNAAAKIASGELLCFLNNDVEMIDPDWLSLMAPHAIKSDVGAVGARLLYPDGTIQHAGVFTGIGGGAGHAHRFLRAEEPGYFERARLPQRVSAVTGACMVVAREKFLAVGGFDEVHFAVAFNDVDLCLKLNQHGWQSFYEPRSTLIHHESKSRGSDRAKANRDRFSGELAALKSIWSTDRIRDPYHHRSLSPFCEQFLIAV